jgi:hypothetical protein
MVRREARGRCWIDRWEPGLDPLGPSLGGMIPMWNSIVLILSSEGSPAISVVIFVHRTYPLSGIISN